MTPITRRLAGAITLTVCLALPMSATAQTPKKVQFGEISLTAMAWPLFVAQERGLYAKHGVEPVVTMVGNVALTVQQVVGGSLDMATTTFDSAIRAIEGGAPLVIVGSTTLRYPFSIMTSAAVKNVADLKGKRIILAVPKDTLTTVWNQWLVGQGMKVTDVEQVFDGATPNRFAALSNNAAQAALLGQPFDFRAADQGFSKLLDIGSFAKDYGFIGLVARPQWLRDNAATARSYLRATSEGLDWLYDPANREAAIDILAKVTKQDRKFAERTYQYYVQEVKPFSPGLDVPEVTVRSVAKLLADNGDIKPNPAAPKKYTDLSLLPGK